MRNIWIIAKNTLKLEIRDKILYGIIIFGLLYVLFSLFMADLVLKEIPMVKAFGLTGIYFFNAIIALFLGTTSFFKDVDRRVVYFILSKPVSRAQFLLGKFLGLCLVLLLTSAILGVAYVGVVLYEHGGFDWIGLGAIGMQFLEMALFLAFAIFVSTFSSSVISIVYTSAVFFLGHIVSQLVTDAKAINLGGIRLWLVEILYYIFPNLEKFDARDFAIHVVAIPWTEFALALAYAVVYAVVLLGAAIWIFDKKEL
ncbi:MAG TPA: ABC transporter permease subunit [Candidatus Paceibacterota bacterium]|nr:ABC transporter permease subunit [Candidatus Paceibacterota bacterium]